MRCRADLKGAVPIRAPPAAVKLPMATAFEPKSTGKRHTPPCAAVLRNLCIPGDACVNQHSHAVRFQLHRGPFHAAFCKSALSLAKGHLDRVETNAVGRQEEALGAGRPDRLTNPCALVAGEVQPVPAAALMKAERVQRKILPVEHVIQKRRPEEHAGHVLFGPPLRRLACRAETGHRATLRPSRSRPPASSSPYTLHPGACS